MESLLLSTSGSARRVYLYALSDGIPLYFKHNELLQTDGYRLLWWGMPNNVTEQEAAEWVAPCQPAPAQYHNYEQTNPDLCLPTALDSFRSAVAQMCRKLEYAIGTAPGEVLIGEILS
ncbi:hypothetical protein [Hymenobacter canadensis]|uniref:HipA N-terminal subdomain 1 domain-containing protein n=1 Tax=Hymenobacter canadensis TaxID=2999067 RepID=A0ABY7LK03_9BACT|nr:hypothetical protein [Hymenobacter canadensis]WBA40758.1 hypothetical protein O3303_13115 [Hymenobacter canadensis]